MDEKKEPRVMLGEDILSSIHAVCIVKSRGIKAVWPCKLPLRGNTNPGVI